MTKIAAWIYALAVCIFATTTAFGQKTQSNTNPAYVCTGFGEEERNDPRWQTFPVKLIFATAGGAYYTDVDVMIVDSAGAEVLRAHCDAPWLLVTLRPGTYHVTARATNGETVTARLTAPSQGQVSLAIRFPGISR